MPSRLGAGRVGDPRGCGGLLLQPLARQAGCWPSRLLLPGDTQGTGTFGTPTQIPVAFALLFKSLVR